MNFLSFLVLFCGLLLVSFGEVTSIVPAEHGSMHHDQDQMSVHVADQELGLDSDNIMQNFVTFILQIITNTAFFDSGILVGHTLGVQFDPKTIQTQLTQISFGDMNKKIMETKIKICFSETSDFKKMDCYDGTIGKARHYNILSNSYHVKLIFKLEDKDEDETTVKGSIDVASNPTGEVKFTKNASAGATEYKLAAKFEKAPSSCSVLYIKEADKKDVYVMDEISGDVLSCKSGSVCNCTSGVFTVNTVKEGHQPFLVDNLYYGLPRNVEKYDKPSSSGLGTGAIIGIVVGVVVLILVCIAIYYFYSRK